MADLGFGQTDRFPLVQRAAEFFDEFVIEEHDEHLTLVHLPCGEDVCWVEVDDTLAVLLVTANRHRC